MRSPKRTEARDGRSERPDSRRSRQQPLHCRERRKQGPNSRHTYQLPDGWPNLTSGGLEISASFCTVKPGFTP